MNWNNFDIKDYGTWPKVDSTVLAKMSDKNPVEYDICTNELFNGRFIMSFNFSNDNDNSSIENMTHWAEIE